MKPPDREATREALAYLSAVDVQAIVDLKPLEAAARAWSRIAPDADGEWPDEVVERLSKILYEHLGQASDNRVVADESWVWDGEVEPIKEVFRDDVRAVLAELHRLAEGSDE